MTDLSSIGSVPQLWTLSILGLILVACGFLSRSTEPEKDTLKCKPSKFTWVSVIVGFVMLLPGFLMLMKMSTRYVKAPFVRSSSAPNANVETEGNWLWLPAKQPFSGCSTSDQEAGLC